MRTKRFGKTEIDRVEENGRFLFQPHMLFIGTDVEFTKRHKQSLGERIIDNETSSFVISFHSFVVRANGKVILVDTCNGNHKERYGLPWQHKLASDNYIKNLKKVGLTPEDIDLVMCTHLHGDHIGWNTYLVNGRWKPTFPNARYIMSQQDYGFFESQNRELVDGKPKHLAFADSILPIAEAGLIDCIDILTTPMLQIADGVTVEAAVGHTVGTVLMRVEGGRDSGYLTGDIIHHPIQFLVPDLINPGDQDPVAARKTRDELIVRIANEGAMLLPAHFPDPSAGRIFRKPEGGYRFEFEAE